MPQQTKVLLIITGGIAACKSLDLVRLLRRKGIAVQCVLTESATQFVTPLSLETLSGNRVASELFDLTMEHEIGHIQLSRQADKILIAPATANFLGKIANGLADDLASTVALAADKPLWFAPAMNVQMWEHPATQRNVAQLQTDGHFFIGPESGDMACGEFGLGRMSEPEDILKAFLGGTGLAGRTAIVTVGATQEPIDPVRYLSNHSSGKQGMAIAQALQEQGARVTVIAGAQVSRLPGTAHVACKTAQDMLEATQAHLPADIFVGCAAVSDWRAALTEPHKMKKQTDRLTLELVQNPDILSYVGHLPAGDRPSLVIGFAAETQNVLENARDKRTRKACDWIVANDVTGDVMGGAHNTVTLITQATETAWPHMSKAAVATHLIDKIVQHFNPKIVTC